MQSENRYPEYCKTKAFLDQALGYLRASRSHRVMNLQTKFDYGKLLDHAFMRQNMADLNKQIYRIGDKVDSFQMKLSDYFTQMAEFDRQKSELDLSYWQSTWNRNVRGITQKTPLFTNQLKDIFKLALSMIHLEIVENIVDLAVYVSNMANPVAWLVGGSATTAMNVKDATKKLAKAGAVKTRLQTTMATQLPKLQTIEKRIKKKEKVTREKFSVMIKLVNGIGPFTDSEAEEFLKTYGEFSPCVTAADVAEYHAILSGLVDTACAAIQNADTVAGVAVETVEAAGGSCSEVSECVCVCVCVCV